MKLTLWILLFTLIQMSDNTIWDIATTRSQWRIVNDDVMGGLSSSKVTLTKKSLTFSGHVSLDNNGGFAMVQYNCNTSVKKFTKLVLDLKGDGKTYQFRLRSGRDDYYSYVQNFKTSGNTEQVILNLEDFYPAFRGRKLQLSNFNQETITQIAILIGNKIEEDFKLDIISVGLK